MGLDKERTKVLQWGHGYRIYWFGLVPSNRDTPPHAQRRQDITGIAAFARAGAF